MRKYFRLKIWQKIFIKKVYERVKKIPRGSVATYGQIAVMLGRPRSAQTVGWALHVCPKNIPWRRVINRVGLISIVNKCTPKTLQAALLKADGVKVIKKKTTFSLT